MAKSTTAPETAPPAKKTPSLFALEQDQQALIDLLTEVGGDVTDDQVAGAIDDWLLEIAQNESTKLDAYAQVIRRLELDASVATAEKERYTALAKVRENAAKRLKDRLKEYLEQAGKLKIETQHHKFSVCTNGGVQPLSIHDIAALPEDYIDYTPAPANERIAEALLAGKEVPGASLEARGTHLRIN